MAKPEIIIQVTTNQFERMLFMIMLGAAVLFGSMGAIGGASYVHFKKAEIKCEANND